MTPASTPRQKVILVTGMSGAGKTTALKAFEDMGHETVDNIPLSLLGHLLHPPQPSLPVDGVKGRPLAIGVDIRTRDFATAALLEHFDELLKDERVEVMLLFIDCSDAVLHRRYDETRHRHPLALDRPVMDGIRHERRLLTPLRQRADQVVDTTDMGVGELKRALQVRFDAAGEGRLAVFVTSFGFKKGLPRDADLVFDVRFLRNPHYVDTLRPLTGRDPEVAEYVAADQGFDDFFTRLTALIDPLLPRYRQEGKSYLTIALGCTGGRHRSVFVAEKLARHLSGQGVAVQIRHRDTPA